MKIIECVCVDRQVLSLQCRGEKKTRLLDVSLGNAALVPCREGTGASFPVGKPSERGYPRPNTGCNFLLFHCKKVRMNVCLSPL